MNRRAQLNADPRIHAVLSSLYDRRGCKAPEVPPDSDLDVAWMCFCADQHEQEIHQPSHPQTVRTYAALQQELLLYWDLFRKAGYRFELWPGLSEPYPNSAAMLRDVRERYHLWVFRNSNDFPVDHPFAAPSPVPGWTFNEVYRAIHDLAGHAWTGADFSAQGEELACQAQCLLHTSAALPALICETRLQSAWIYFGPHRRDHRGALLRSPFVLLRFPKQKAFAAPIEAIDYNIWQNQQDVSTKG